MAGQRYLGHLVTVIEAGPGIFELRCSCDGNTGQKWQSFTWHGENHARELANDHILAARLADRDPHIDKALKRDLYGYGGVR